MYIFRGLGFDIEKRGEVVEKKIKIREVLGEREILLEEEIHSVLTCYLRLEIDGEFEYLEPGDAILIREIGEKTICRGAYKLSTIEDPEIIIPFREYIPCCKEAISNEIPWCKHHCNTPEARYLRFLFGTLKELKEDEYLVWGPHLVYVAYLHSKGKVGICSARRYLQRAAEQLSKAFVPIVITDLKHARQLEEYLSATINKKLYQKISISEKLQEFLKDGKWINNMIHLLTKIYDGLRKRGVSILLSHDNLRYIRIDWGWEGSLSIHLNSISSILYSNGP